MGGRSEKKPQKGIYRRNIQLLQRVYADLSEEEDRFSRMVPEMRCTNGGINFTDRFKIEIFSDNMMN